MSPASHVSTDKTLELQPIDSACPNCNAIGIDWKLAVCPKCGWCLEPVEFGSYRAEVLLGEGGMGRVYRAVDDKLGRRVAVKTLLPHLVGDVGTMARFERESKLAASLRHPNLVSIFEVGRTREGAPYLVMEYIEGRSLKQVLVAEAPLQPSRAIFLVEQLLAGLGEAHARGVVHRDLKPANVLVTMLSDGTELCKVVDFGIARQLSGEETDRRLTKTGLLVGTPGYMAPEQIESMECDHRIDLYAVGSVLYELLTGARPFRGASEAEVLMKTMTELPVPPSRRVSTDISSGLDDIVLKALSKKPEDRFGSALEFRQALRTRKATSEQQLLGSVGDGIVIDRTPLAAAQLGRQARPNPRSIFSSLLEASDDWSRSRMLEPFQSAVETAIAERDEAELTALFRQVSEASKGAVELEDVAKVLRELFLHQANALLEWQLDANLAALATWMLRFGGDAIRAWLFDDLETVLPDERSLRIRAIRALFTPAELQQIVRAAGTTLVKLLVQDTAHWSVDEAVPFIGITLQLPQAEQRCAALEGLTEGLALASLKAVQARLHDPHLKVRDASRKWILQLKPAAAVVDLSTLMRRPGTSADERLATARVLVRLGDRGIAAVVNGLGTETDARVLKELIQLISRPDVSLAVRAVERLNRDPKTPPLLKRAAQEQLDQLVGKRPPPVLQRK